MVRSKKWLIRSGILSLVAGSTLVVGVACAGATDVSGLEEDVAGLSAQVTALQQTVNQAVAALGGATGADGDAGTGAPTTAVENRLDTIIERGRLICGVQGGTPGFGNANRVGHDADYCRAVAAAIFGEATTGAGGTLEFISAGSGERFTLLAEGTIDVLIRTTTWTSGRDTTRGAQFTATTFYDQFGLMVSPSIAGNITNFDDLDQARVCVRAGTSTEEALEALENQFSIDFTEVPPASDAEVQDAFAEGQCDIIASDQSQLAGFRSEFTGDLQNSVILSGAQLVGSNGEVAVLAKEPLGPSTHESGGFEWNDVVQWVNYGLITAEEQGVTQANVDSLVAQGSSLPDITETLLGLKDPNLAFASKLEGGDTFMQNVIRAVGNFGEIYERNLGSGGIGLQRACTAQALANPPESSWEDCDGDGTATFEENRGLIYAPRYGQ